MSNYHPHQIGRRSAALWFLRGGAFRREAAVWSGASGGVSAGEFSRCAAALRRQHLGATIQSFPGESFVPGNDSSLGIAPSDIAPEYRWDDGAAEHSSIPC